MATKGSYSLGTHWLDNYYLKFAFAWEVVYQTDTESKISYNITANNVGYDEEADELGENITSPIPIDYLEIYIMDKSRLQTTRAEIPRLRAESTMTKDILADDRQITLTHEPDGTLIFDVEVEMTFESGEMLLLSGTVDNVPSLKATQAIISRADNITDEENTFVKWRELNTNYIASVEAAIMDESETIYIAQYRKVDITSIQYDFIFTEAERKLLRKNITGANYTYYKAFLKTTTSTGEVLYDWKRFKVELVNAKTTIFPEMYDTNEETLALTGNKKICVNDYSLMYYNFDSTLKKEAVGKFWRINGVNGYSESGCDNFTLSSNKVKFELQDNRNNIAEDTVILNEVINYIAPTVSYECGKIDGNGNVSIELFGDYWNGNFGAVDNTLTLEYRYSVGNEEQFSDWIVISNVNISNLSYSITLKLTGLDYKSIHYFEFRVSDKLNVVMTDTKIQSFPVFSWSKTDFDFNVPVTSMGYNLTAVGSLIKGLNLKATVNDGSDSYMGLDGVENVRLIGNTLIITPKISFVPTSDMGVAEIGSINIDDTNSIISKIYKPSIIMSSDTYGNIYFFKVDIDKTTITLTRLYNTYVSDGDRTNIWININMPVEVNLDQILLEG